MFERFFSLFNKQCFKKTISQGLFVHSLLEDNFRQQKILSYKYTMKDEKPLLLYEPHYNI